MPGPGAWLPPREWGQADLPLPQCAQGQRPRPTNNSPGVCWSCIGAAKHAGPSSTGQVRSTGATSWVRTLLYWSRDQVRLYRTPGSPIVPQTENAAMPKQPKPPTRLQGRTDSPQFASRVRSPQAPAAAAAALMPLILAGAGTRPQIAKRGKRGERGR
jgi:hypothetical protein